MQSNSTGYITDIVYTDNYYEHLSPVALNYLAALNGHRPRDLADFDYCELGCGAGMSLLVHAAAHPGGRFVGIDLNPEHIDQCRRRAVEAGLTNLNLVAEPVGDPLTDSGLPEFDFIVMHGLYAWVSESVRSAIRRFIDARLKPGGLVLVSYNAWPGCAARQPLRDIMRRFALPLSENSLERAQLGLSYLRLMLNAQAPFFQLNPELRKYAESLFERDLHYIAHEFFNDHWNPLGVEQVATEMAETGLRFGGCLPLWQNHPEADVPENLAGLFAGEADRIVREVHKDFIYNTVFRTDLYVRPANGGTTAVGRADALWQMPFGATVASEAVQLTMQRGTLQLPLNTREGRILFNLLQDGPRTPAELAQSPKLDGVTPAVLVEALCWWVLSGQVRPVANRAPDTAMRATAARLNRTLLTAALKAEGQEKAWLTSPLFGVAFPFDKTLALALCVLSGSAEEGGSASLGQLLREAGLSVEEEGQPLDDDALAGLAQDLADDLEDNGTLEQARLLGLAG